MSPPPDCPPPEGTPGAFQRMAERALGAACALVLLSMMGLTAVDVIARYGFNAPLRGAFETTEILLVVLVYMALPLAVLAQAHIEVELWAPKSPTAKRLRWLLSGLCGVGVFAVIAYQIFEHGLRLAGRNAVSNALGIPLSLIAFIAAFGAALCAALALHHLIRKVISP